MGTIILRRTSHSHRDGLLIALALAHGGLMVLCPSMLLIAIGLWWNANTISHNFIHRPFFRSRVGNSAFSLYLTLLLGFPQSLWRARHLGHHGVRDRSKLKLEPLDVAGAVALWGVLIFSAPDFVFAVYLPGFLAGLGLCFVHGHYEHANGAISHYSSLYNLLLFNDGYHVEHHRHPGVHWRELRYERALETSESRWPAVLRWLECANLCALERLALGFPAIRSFVLARHEHALRTLSVDALPIGSVGIVGGGLFPRTAIILGGLIPRARLSIIEMNPENIDTARSFLGEVNFVRERFEPASKCEYDLLVIPLAFVGNRDAIYRNPPARFVLVHDWIWRKRRESAMVSWLLLKRINLVRR